LEGGPVPPHRQPLPLVSCCPKHRWLPGAETRTQCTGNLGVRTSFPPNWEELLGVLLFIGTAVCAFSAHSVRVLPLNLFVALLISFAGFFIISSNPDTLPRDSRRFFSWFLPRGGCGSRCAVRDQNHHSSFPFAPRRTLPRYINRVRIRAGDAAAIPASENLCGCR
jgi:hypothetical protein